MKNLIMVMVLLGAATATSNAAINLTINNSDQLSGDFQVDLGSGESQLGIAMAELNSFGLDGSSSAFMDLFVEFSPSVSSTLVEYVQQANQDPPTVFDGNEVGTITAALTGGRAINYSFTNVYTDSSTIVGDFVFTAVPEPTSYALLIGGSTLMLVMSRRRRHANV
ncbi:MULTISPECIES: PEP-CTERM sorting domain-containing protein [unclassified Lentimonas]|uniref:PEP-CTERM sorting domain-containing protein n=1 Tax=unclassified Lentimonas TaxID=2630993 RepID=UPI001325864A|nr:MULTISPECIES: PEP-CTERM sorting domain-containing protein [unclassified Lentimonas]CAA6677048.1 Unannotated [Lentimonas sp. CC4]CAA6687241.1 Unannotated [Lentimonas sp. CC6]CAA7074358.1 Unannotated [Lentimonas sp. CC4]CAA7171455.1 Unannotated [Lentimonas sp. CC21]CAA7180049.1 Unannotated [Lentimonas sp. CC8]